MKRMGRFVVAVLLLQAMLFMPMAQAGTLKKGAPFVQSRAQLIKDGWRPVNVHAGEDYEYIGIETVLAEAKIYEVESCAVDRALCIFNYQQGKRCLRVVTSGEALPAMSIESWSSRCPAPRSPDDK
jgi:hypothetical protein